MLSRLALRPFRPIKASEVTVNSTRNAYIHFKRKWDVNSYDEMRELRKMLGSITDKDAMMATIANRCEEPDKAEWPEPNRMTRRAGVIAKKLGCMSYWTRDGESHAMCALQILDSTVMDVSVMGPDDRTGVWMAGGQMTAEEIAKTPDYKLEPFRARSMHPCHEVRFMGTSIDSLLPVKTVLGSSHFRCGQFVDVLGTSIDRGFQGGMKRHGFKGLPASHGVTRAHRAIGAIGHKKDGLWRGTKMPGHMGGYRRYARCMRVVRVDHKNNVIFVRGRHTIGYITEFVSIHDATYYPPHSAVPHPTHFTARDGELPEQQFWDEVIQPGSDTFVFEGESN
ncbi:large ribosomal subunit protein uL3-like [Sycon ciliatum]|uniref:large ribosomal subunit protein uL3-like n=1 Tax=Sycon ciliatum TaxID=27933 RepID=UPI0020AB0099|eukprot:scpid84479/ scgid17484/ 39S ribosomal protein L3, mitochondrial